MLPRHIPPLWHACGMALVLALLLLTRRAALSHILILFIFRLPGVLLHELAHLMAGMLLRAEPESFSLLPRRRPGGWTLGSVAFRRVTPFNAVPIALAPILLLPAALLLPRHWFGWLPPTLGSTLLLYAALFILVHNALPSRQDLRVACNWRSLLLYGGAGCAAGYLWLHYYA